MTKPEFNYLVAIVFAQTEIILNLAYLIFFDYDKITFNIFILVLDMITGYQVSFPVKTTQKLIFLRLKLAR